MSEFKVGIIGAGLIGKKRAEAILGNRESQIIAVADIDHAKAEEFAIKYRCSSTTNWEEVIKRRDINIVVIATPNKFLTPIAIAALKEGKHVLCEKPLGRTPEESKEILASRLTVHGSRFTVLKTGFNHRHHPAIAQTKQLVDNGEIGDLYFMRCRYGHGGRAGYEKEWRADKELCGGGELLDQGVHVVDLFRWFAGNFNEAFGYTQTYFWNMDVEDNAFAIFKQDSGVIAAMHTSWTQWKNLFSFEIFGSKGYLIIEGLGGSYGTETLKIGRRKLESGPPDETIIEFPDFDVSWKEEWKEFISAIKDNREPIGNGWDGYQANKMLAAVYESARRGKVVRFEA
ncbi:MAG: Gfo/Idh/MocA family oxidoreductase [Nitrospirae bacterium]|nr:Gfo/Idh/MocA family oxidoreductase [Nitrospirota bacterium]